MESKEKRLIKVAGVTMVALVVTIIILLILAGVVITLVVGDNGIITRAKRATEIYKKAEENEQIQLNNLYTQLASYDSVGGNDTVDTNELLNQLKTEMLKSMYPVGSIYISAEISTKEEIESKLGGIWENYGQGRTLVGVGEGNDGKISKVFVNGETGGEYNHVLTIEEMPSHTHNTRSYKWTDTVSSRIFYHK